MPLCERRAAREALILFVGDDVREKGRERDRGDFTCFLVFGSAGRHQPPWLRSVCFAMASGTEWRVLHACQRGSQRR